MRFSGRSTFLPCRLAVALLLVASTLAGCATPTSRLRDFAAERGFERRAVKAGGFELTVFENAAFGDAHAPAAASPAASSSAASSTLHVYLEGDGTPWVYRVIVTPDPTPRRPLMLGLMSLDDAPSIYVGRPCYNGTSGASGCDDTLWTSARYSATVVDSMAKAIRVIARRGGYSALRLFGHSGGGTLALLLAPRLEGVLDVVTVAGNLDIEAWTRHHGYSPLRDSLNPASEPALAPDVGQWHLLGGGDRVVPPTLVRPFIARADGSTGVLFPSFSHGCCWSRVWPGVLRAVTRDDVALLPGTVFRRAGEAADRAGARSPSAASIRAG